MNPLYCDVCQGALPDCDCAIRAANLAVFGFVPEAAYPSPSSLPSADGADDGNAGPGGPAGPAGLPAHQASPVDFGSIDEAFDFGGDGWNPASHSEPVEDGYNSDLKVNNEGQATTAAGYSDQYYPSTSDTYNHSATTSATDLTLPAFAGNSEIIPRSYDNSCRSNLYTDPNQFESAVTDANQISFDHGAWLASLSEEQQMEVEMRAWEAAEYIRESQKGSGTLS